MSPEQGILILILTLALIGALTCLYLTFKLLRFLLRLLFGSASQRRIREIRRLGQEARQEMDLLSDDYLQHLIRLSRR